MINSDGFLGNAPHTPPNFSWTTPRVWPNRNLFWIPQEMALSVTKPTISFSFTKIEDNRKLRSQFLMQSYMTKGLTFHIWIFIFNIYFLTHDSVDVLASAYKGRWRSHITWQVGEINFNLCFHSLWFSRFFRVKGEEFRSSGSNCHARGMFGVSIWLMAKDYFNIWENTDCFE